MKLYRSVRDKRLSGLCGGLAEMLNVDATVLRLVVLIAAFFSGGTVVLIYILASIVVPKETDVYKGDPYNDPYSNPYNDPYSSHYNNPFKKKDFRHERPQYKEEPKDTSPNIDDMMEDIEKKAMWKEIEELRAKLAQFEKEKGEK